MRIDLSFAKALVSNYRKNHWSMINGGNGRPACPSLLQNPNFPTVQDSRSVWFSLDDLKDFIAEIESTTATGELGVRIYFGEYSTAMLTTQPQNAQYAGLHTLLMVPTVEKADGFNHDFDPATGSSDFTTSVDMSALNHGTLIPPPFFLTGGTQNSTAQPQPQLNLGQDFMLFCDANP
jgi:hypothetical protein